MPSNSYCPWKSRLSARHTSAMAILLLRAGIISQDEYFGALDIASSLETHIDEVIASIVSEEQRKACLHALVLIARGTINEELAIKGLIIANARGLNILEGLKYFGFGW